MFDSIFLYAIIPEKRIWTIGIMVMLIGVVTSAFAYFNTRDA